ncbi:MAG: amino acid adenylation domain-containing protein, partial [Acidobacteriota bacterium]
KFDLTLSVVESDSGMLCTMHYNRELFEASTIVRMAEHFTLLLESAVAAPESKIATLSILSEAEQQQLLCKWNDTNVEYQCNQGIHQFFEEQVKRRPDAIALFYENQYLTYQELNRRANQLANYLRDKDVRAETIVAICLENSCEMVVALLAVLKAGGAYLPLDPTYPKDRLTLIISDAQASLLIAQRRTISFLSIETMGLLLLDEEWESISHCNGDNLDNCSVSSNLAYLIYTSGSTGRPKGVMVSHQEISNYLHWMCMAFPLNETDRVLQTTSLSFDVSVREIFWPLWSGAAVVLMKSAERSDIDALLKLVEKHQVTNIRFIPSMLRMIAAAPTAIASSLKRVFSGGEAMPAELSEQFLCHWNAQLINTYGPTETAVSASSWVCQPMKELQYAPIGQPIANVRIYLLDSNLELVPVGVIGELYIGGAGVARGYFKESVLTAERFIPDLFSEKAGARLYRTGDLARYLPDGNIEFLGRTDHQVKLRGFRIEPAEIESVLCQHPGVYAAIVMAGKDERIGVTNQLIAYIVSRIAMLRIPLRCKCEVEDIEYQGERITLTTEDLSFNGACLIDVPADWQPNRKIRLYLQTTDSERQLQIDSTVIWVDRSYAGIRFDSDTSVLVRVQQLILKHTQAEGISVVDYRRRALRVPVQTTCYVETDDRTLILSVKDISLSGICLTKVPNELQLLQRVKLKLQWLEISDELQLEGVVVWRQNGHAGIQFDPQPQIPEQTILRQNISRVIESRGFSIANLNNFLRSKLPDYMVPSSFVLLDKLPLTPNGKIDRRALLALDRAELLLELKKITPHNQWEELVAVSWRELLNLNRLSVDDNFFELGGHSLLATQLISRLRLGLGIELPLRMLFEKPKLAEFASEIERIMQQEERQVIVPMLPAPRTDKMPLSFAQQRLWLLNRLQPDSTQYNIPVVLRIIGQLDLNALEQSINEIIKRHEILRTAFVEIDGKPIQVIVPELKLTISIEDLTGLSETEQDLEVKRLIKEITQQQFDLSQIPLLGFKVYKLDKQSYVMSMVMHHIISDGWSIGVIMQEIKALYQVFTNKLPSTLPPLKIQYADFAYWQRQWLRGEVLQTQLSYWKRQLGSDLPVLQLPLDRPRTPLQNYQGAVKRFVLSKQLTEDLNVLSNQENVTLFMMLLAAFNVLLARYSNQNDISIGTPIAGRSRAEIEPLIGFFVNTLVMRTDLSGNPSLLELLARVREVCLAAYAHQDLPFERLVEELQPERNLSRTPLFQVMFVLQNTPISDFQLSDLTISPVVMENSSAKFDLMLLLAESKQGVSGTFEYNTDLFDETTITRLADHYENLLTGIINHPQHNIMVLPLLSKAEEHRLLVEWNDTTNIEYRNQSMHQRFQDQVECTPAATALVFEQERLSYRELNQRANQLAHYLRTIGVREEVLVGICTQRCSEMIVAMLAVL